MSEWVVVPTGRFAMGTDLIIDGDYTDAGPSRLVTVGAFEISIAPVSQRRFREFVDATGFVTVAETERSGFVGPDHELVQGADWRRPSGPDEDDRTGEDEPVTQVAWFDAVAYCQWSSCRLPTEPEWEYAATTDDRFGSGLWQWCNDWYSPDFHRFEQRVNPTGPTSGTMRVAKGGTGTTSDRGSFMPDMSSDDLGFRVVRLPG